MSQVNLLPPDIVQGQRYRRLTVMVILAGAIVVALVIAFFLLQAQRLSSVNGDIEAQQQNNAAIQQEIDGLQKFEDLQVEAQAKQGLLAAAYANEVAFSGLLMDLSQITPSSSYLQSLSVTITPPATDTGTTDTTGTTFVGNMSMGGQAIGVDTLSDWLTRLEQVQGWVNPWMSSITKTEGTSTYTFSTTVDLTQDVVTPRGRGEVTNGG